MTVIGDRSTGLAGVNVRRLLRAFMLAACVLLALLVSLSAIQKQYAEPEDVALAVVTVFAAIASIRSRTRIGGASISSAGSLDSGLYGGAAAGLVSGALLAVVYYLGDRDRVPFLRTLIEVILFTWPGFCLLGFLCQLFASGLLAKRFYWLRALVGRELWSGLFAGLVVGIVMGPLMGWYFGRYYQMRPFCPPSLTMNTCLPGAVIAGMVLILCRRQYVSWRILRDAIVLVAITIVLGLTGALAMDLTNADKFVFTLMYGSGTKADLMIGGGVYVGIITVALGLHLGGGAALARTWLARQTSTEAAQPIVPESTMNILFLAANPTTTSPLDLEEELRSIGQEIRTTQHRDKIKLVSHHAVRPDDLVRYIREVAPTVVHFSGHGSQQGIVLRSDLGRHQVVSGKSLRRFFRDRGVALVVLNACYTEQQAEQLEGVIPAVVGTTNAVGDEAARRFSVAFYRALGNGLSIHEAFRDGGDAVALHDLPDVFCSRGSLERILLDSEGLGG